MTDKHLLVFVLIIVSVALALLILGTAIPQTRPGPFYDVDQEQCPKKNVGIYITILTSYYLYQLLLIKELFIVTLIGERYSG